MIGLYKKAVILFDYIGNRACEEAEKKFIEYLKRNELQKSLLECFKKAGVKTDDNIKEKILGIDSDKIKPNMSKEEIRNSLKELFCNIIDNNEEYYGKSENMKNCICSEYLKTTRKNILELYHVLDVLENVKADITDLIKSSERQQEAAKKVDELHTELLKRRGNEIHFIEELDSSKVFFYCEIEICTYYQGIEEIFGKIFEHIRDESSIYFSEKYEYGEVFCTIYIQFAEPLVQYKFREFLKHINSLFAEEVIMISRITTHF